MRRGAIGGSLVIAFLDAMFASVGVFIVVVVALSSMQGGGRDRVDAVAFITPRDTVSWSLAPDAAAALERPISSSTPFTVDQVLNTLSSALNRPPRVVIGVPPSGDRARREILDDLRRAPGAPANAAELRFVPVPSTDPDGAAFLEAWRPDPVPTPEPPR